MKTVMTIKKVKELDDGSIGLIGTLSNSVRCDETIIVSNSEAPSERTSFILDDIWKFKTPDGTPGEYLSEGAPGEKVMLITDSLTIDDVQIGDKILSSNSRSTSNRVATVQTKATSEKSTKPWYKKWWVWVIIALVLVIIIALVTPNSSDSTQTSQTKSPIQITKSTTAKAKTYQKVTPQQLHKDRHDNAAAAKDKWDGKNIELTGKFESIDSDGLFFELEPVYAEDIDDFDSTSFYCYFTNDTLRETAKKLKKGQSVTIKGTVKDVDDLGSYEINVDTIQ